MCIGKYMEDLVRHHRQDPYPLGAWLCGFGQKVLHGSIIGRDSR